ncbi:MAG: NAD(P) transhydrogenase subunit alpha [Planctomycetes bacterium]|jgi:NAD(P) transhydrogenase subunit alpha|nr:NAD(P) transhydrogenase subunit alpha [Planctomycetota bacterium]
MTGEVLMGFYTFVLACVAGFQLINKVPPTLHTPLMSGANAISGITILGALVVAGGTGGLAAHVIGMLAVLFATVNVVGGFMVTERMLKMFGSKK